MAILLCRREDGGQCSDCSSLRFRQDDYGTWNYGKEDNVFALLGPKRYDVPWKTLESRGYIAETICTEYRVPLSSKEELTYAHADKRAKFRIAAENERKKSLCANFWRTTPVRAS
ncbi:MAG: hypothetical protein EF813_02300 [Methanosarcinales archaeon]|nr:MAG: hypothetical protein EF813_02300 [Methanosarcinales archaeon]